MGEVVFRKCRIVYTLVVKCDQHPRWLSDRLCLRCSNSPEIRQPGRVLVKRSDVLHSAVQSDCYLFVLVCIPVHQSITGAFCSILKDLSASVAVSSSLPCQGPLHRSSLAYSFFSLLISSLHHGYQGGWFAVLQHVIPDFYGSSQAQFLREYKLVVVGGGGALHDCPLPS